jgi:NAD(P)-dependent dehydrogenase (short-subunit alcohol dehydrogenase family)
VRAPRANAICEREVRARSGGSIDTIVAVAGLAAPIPATAAVNYFGMVATLDGLCPLLAGSDSPRAVGVASFASIAPGDGALIAAFRAADESTALARATALAAGPTGALIYPSSKAAFAQWVRRSSTTNEWAGAGIPLNAIAPGVVSTSPVRSSDLCGRWWRSDRSGRLRPVANDGRRGTAVPQREHRRLGRWRATRRGCRRGCGLPVRRGRLPRSRR